MQFSHESRFLLFIKRSVCPQKKFKKNPNICSESPRKTQKMTKFPWTFKNILHV